MVVKELTLNCAYLLQDLQTISFDYDNIHDWDFRAYMTDICSHFAVMIEKGAVVDSMSIIGVFKSNESTKLAIQYIHHHTTRKVGLWHRLFLGKHR